MSRVLVQFNVAKMLIPFDDAAFDDFKARLVELHTLAEQHEGFVWRYQGEKDEDGYIKPYPSAPLIMGNLSAWRDYESLYDYTFSQGHLELLKMKRKWFRKIEGPHNVLYYADKADLLDADIMERSKRRLTYFRIYGETPAAFSWGHHQGVL